MVMTQRRESTVMGTRNWWNRYWKSSQRENPLLVKRQKRGSLDCMEAFSNPSISSPPLTSLKEILTDRQLQDYQSHYLDLQEKWRKRRTGDKENINDDLVFETELIRQVEINIDYILLLVQKYHDTNCTNKEILVNITKAIGSSMQLRSKKELIENFISSVNADTDVDQSWRDYVQQQKEEDLKELIETENLKPEETTKFIESSFRDGQVRTTGTDIDKILPPMSRFGGGNRQEKKKTVIQKIQTFFERYFGL